MIQALEILGGVLGVVAMMLGIDWWIARQLHRASRPRFVPCVVIRTEPLDPELPP